MRGPAGASEWYDRSVRVFPLSRLRRQLPHRGSQETQKSSLWGTLRKEGTPMICI